MIATEDRVIYTMTQLADRWGVSRDTVDTMLRAGKVRGFRVGKQWRITAEAVGDYEQGADQ
jgi:excisionase family DNA binding protein